MQTWQETGRWKRIDKIWDATEMHYVKSLSGVHGRSRLNGSFFFWSIPGAGNVWGAGVRCSYRNTGMAQSHTPPQPRWSSLLPDMGSSGH